MISLPLTIKKGKFKEEKSLKISIDNNISQLLETPLYTLRLADNYGFLLNNLRFENINETENRINKSQVISNSQGSTARNNELSISGISNNENTFAAELKKTLSQYEPRLENIKVNMTYIGEEKIINISIIGVITSTGEDYSLYKEYRIWN